MNRTITTIDVLREARIGERVDVKDIAGAVYVGKREERLPTIAYRKGERIMEQTFYILRNQNPHSRAPQNKIEGVSTFREITPGTPEYSVYSKLLNNSRN